MQPQKQLHSYNRNYSPTVVSENECDYSHIETEGKAVTPVEAKHINQVVVTICFPWTQIVAYPNTVTADGV